MYYVIKVTGLDFPFCQVVVQSSNEVHSSQWRQTGQEANRGA